MRFCYEDIRGKYSRSTAYFRQAWRNIGGNSAKNNARMLYPCMQDLYSCMQVSLSPTSCVQATCYAQGSACYARLLIITHRMATWFMSEIDLCKQTAAYEYHLKLYN